MVRHAVPRAEQGPGGDRSPVELTYIARQPIFDRGLDVVGYELLHRPGPDPEARVSDPQAATMQVVDSALVEFGLQHLVGDGRAFINVTREFLVQGMHLVFPPTRVVFELVERTVVDAALMESLSLAKSEGYNVALDDFTGRDEEWPLVDLARMVKIDLLLTEDADLDDHVRRLKDAGTTLVAEKVETYEDLERCRDLGFDMFQGFFFARPSLLRKSVLSPDRIAAARLLAELHQPDVDVRELAEIIRRDVTLTYRVLTIVNSALYGLPRKIESVHQAIVLLGLDMIRNFASLIAMSLVRGKPSELVTTAVLRARMCELLAKSSGDPTTADGAFIVGLLSVLEALMDTPLTEILERLPLAEPIEAALLAREGSLGDLLAAVERYERGALADLAEGPYPLSTMTEAYLDAVRWVVDIRASLSVGEGPRG
jgi:EAL and modified HD-GYP domain-containing signal transduction protein